MHMRVCSLLLFRMDRSLAGLTVCPYVIVPERSSTNHIRKTVFETPSNLLGSKARVEIRKDQDGNVIQDYGMTRLVG